MAARDEAEFVEYVQSSAPRLRRLAYLMCGDWHQAQDVVQQVYVRLYVAWPRLRRADAFHAYARRTVISVVRDDGRRPWRRQERVTGRVPDMPGADPHAVVDTRIALIRYLQQLPERQRTVIVLRYLEDMTVEQTAELLRIEPGTVKSQASRGLATLRRLLDSAGPVSTVRRPAREGNTP